MVSDEYKLALQEIKSSERIAIKKAKLQAEQNKRNKIFGGVKSFKVGQNLSKEQSMLGELFGQGGKSMFGSNQPIVDMSGGINQGEGLITNRLDSEETGSYFGI